jgi:glycosyltransferase involved in cell wall biosynthesis
MNKSNNEPLVAIGMPIYNNEKHIYESLASIINQDYNNLIINIVDDCSTDKTGEICQKFALNDSRIKYTRNKENIGGGLNFLKTIDKTLNENSKYLFYARGDAFYSKSVVRKCIKSLENNDKIVLAYPIPHWVSSNSRIIKDKKVSYYSSVDNNVLSRSAMAVWNKPFQLYGIMRSNDVKSFFLKYSPFIGHDNALVFHMSICGRFDVIESECWYRRFNYEGESYKARIDRYRNKFLNIKHSFSSYAPNIFLAYKMIKIILNCDRKFLMKIKLIVVLFFTAPLRLLVSYGKSI